MNSELKILLVILGALIVAYLMNKQSEDKFNSNLSYPENSIENFTDTMGEQGNSDSNSSMSMSMDMAHKKTISKNTNKSNKVKKVNYADGDRNQDHYEETELFNESNNLLKNSHLENNDFTGQDETNNKYAAYEGGQPTKMSSEQIFNAENFLPNENNNWFEQIPEPISIKNRTLINVSRPIGVNTIGNSLRNPTYDLRGAPPNPKNIVSPWMNSTIEPDLNNKGLC
jgi:hypothetical protein